MMKKKSVGHHRWRWKVGFVLFFFIVLFTILKLRAFVTYDPMNGYWKLAHSPIMERKLAFLFLARNRMPLDVVWDRFFKDAQEGLFSIYIHSRPGFVYNRRTTSCRHFFNRQLPNSISVDWGEASMIEAERLLLSEALKDRANHRFVLVSDSCIPLYNFTYIYEYIMASSKSFIDSFLDSKEKRYNPKMSPYIQRKNWRKGSQWFVLKREHAGVVAFDSNIFSLFQEHCKRRPLPEFWRQEYVNGDPSKQHNCIPDEHYVQTLLAIKDFEQEIERRAVTYTLWNQSTKDRERKGWHPVTFAYFDATSKLINEIKVHYLTPTLKCVNLINFAMIYERAEFL